MTDVLPGQPASGAKPEAPARLWLRYFDEILNVERNAINERRRLNHRPEIPAPEPKRPERAKDDPIIPGEEEERYDRSAPNPDANPKDPRLGGGGPLNRFRSRPRTEPSAATGLSLSGGGIRSASFCLGVLQALHTHSVIRSLDYLSTVSGGGYIGASLTAAMTKDNRFPFERRNEPRDMPAVGHLRNYSNYLMPRGHAPFVNMSHVIVIVLRGLLANAVLVSAAMLLLAVLTVLLYPRADALPGAGAFAQLCYWIGYWTLAWVKPGWFAHWYPVAWPFLPTFLLTAALCIMLVAWAVCRSVRKPEEEAQQAVGDAEEAPVDEDVRRRQGDAGSLWLRNSTIVFVTMLCFAASDAIPWLIDLLGKYYERPPITLTSVMAFLSAVVAAIGVIGDRLGQFLKTSQHSSALRIVLLRVTTRAFIVIAGLALPALLALALLHVAAWSIVGLEHVARPFAAPPRWYWWGSLGTFGALALVGIWFKPNAYSLHRFYRDRLSRAFLFDPARATRRRREPVPLHVLKLSKIETKNSPYHIVNAALNIQGSLAANRRGRNADFFIFTRHFVGSDLTMFASTDDEEMRRTYANIDDMEKIDPMLDLGTAMAISGAALSANMGSGTVRPLSPTLAMLNVRLGYWLRNPRSLVGDRSEQSRLARLRDNVLTKFYLIPEMFNLLDEKSRNVYLSDGGHIENLGIYELLKRGCRLIIAVDAEADPSMSFGSLIKLQRYARIDFGIRIDLPWQQIVQMTRFSSQFDAPNSGPHCAVGPILYPDGQQGILVYIKSSVSCDEADYVLDYRKRNAAFPHETTSDQFFSEEQFEAYRALGYHAADRFFARKDAFAWSPSGWLPGTTMDGTFARIIEIIQEGAGQPGAA